MYLVGFMWLENPNFINYKLLTSEFFLFARISCSFS